MKHLNILLEKTVCKAFGSFSSNGATRSSSDSSSKSMPPSSNIKSTSGWLLVEVTFVPR